MRNKKPGGEVANPHAGFLNINLVSLVDLASTDPISSDQDSPHNCHAVDPKALAIDERSRGRINEQLRIILRKEVIQPQVPLRLPCYDLVPITEFTLRRLLPCGLAQRLWAPPTFVA